MDDAHLCNAVFKVSTIHCYCSSLRCRHSQACSSGTREWTTGRYQRAATHEWGPEPLSPRRTSTCSPHDINTMLTAVSTGLGFCYFAFTSAEFLILNYLFTQGLVGAGQARYPWVTVSPELLLRGVHLDCILCFVCHCSFQTPKGSWFTVSWEQNTAGDSNAAFHSK